jgi:hypothetical protein
MTADVDLRQRCSIGPAGDWSTCIIVDEIAEFQSRFVVLPLSFYNTARFSSSDIRVPRIARLPRELPIHPAGSVLAGMTSIESQATCECLSHGREN